MLKVSVLAGGVAVPCNLKSAIAEAMLIRGLIILKVRLIIENVDIWVLRNSV